MALLRGRIVHRYCCRPFLLTEGKRRLLPMPRPLHAPILYAVAVPPRAVCHQILQVAPLFDCHLPACHLCRVFQEAKMQEEFTALEAEIFNEMQKCVSDIYSLRQYALIALQAMQVRGAAWGCQLPFGKNALVQKRRGS